LRYLFDTTFIIDLVAGDEGAAKKAVEIDSKASYVAISAVTAQEYLRGVYYLYLDSQDLVKKLEEARKDLSRFEIIPFDFEIAEVAARIDAKLARLGTSIGYADVIVAATAISRDLILVTRNVKHFSKMPEIRVEGY